MPGITWEARQGLGWLIIDRPDKANSLNSETLREARTTLEKACKTQGLLGIIITGRGRFFSAGIDLTEVANARNPRDAARPFQNLHFLIAEILECNIPTYSLINGPAVAGGAEIAIAADYPVAVEGAWLQWPEARFQLIPPLLLAAAAEKRDPRLAWQIAAMDRIPPQQALEAGLIATYTRTAQEAEEIIRRHAETLAELPKTTRALILENTREWKKQATRLTRKLVELAQSRELIEKARQWLQQRK